MMAQARREDLHYHYEEKHVKVDYVVAHGISSTWQEQKLVLGNRYSH